MGLDLGGLFKGGLHRAGELIEQPFQVTRDIIKDPKHGFDTLKKIPGQNERNDSKMLSDGGIGGWVGKHPQESAGALVASIFGGWAAAGAYGAGAAGTAGAAGAGSAGAAGTGASAIGGAGAGAYMAPAAAGGVSTTGGALASSAPATSSLLSMGHAGVGAAGSTAGASSFTPAMLTTQGAAASGGTYGAASAPASASALGTVPASTGASGSSALSDPNTWSQVSRVINSVKPNEQEQQRVSAPQLSPAYRANFRGNKMENQLLTRTMNDIYSQPMYSPLRIK